jgi:hypothetical protein
MSRRASEVPVERSRRDWGAIGLGFVSALALVGIALAGVWAVVVIATAVG